MRIGVNLSGHYVIIFAHRGLQRAEPFIFVIGLLLLHGNFLSSNLNLVFVIFNSELPSLLFFVKRFKGLILFLLWCFLCPIGIKDAWIPTPPGFYVGYLIKLIFHHSTAGITMFAIKLQLVIIFLCNWCQNLDRLLFLLQIRYLF